MNALIDTHTHFDVSEYDFDRKNFVRSALKNGIAHIVLIGLTANRFLRMQQVADEVNSYYFDDLPIKRLGCHLAMGLHPIYVNEHCIDDLMILDNWLGKSHNIAIAEIGLDTYLPTLKDPAIYQKQKILFTEQIQLAKSHQLPIVLHIRKSHSDALQLLKQTQYNANQLGGIAHAFSGGEQEGLAFVKMGFKLGITGQIANPNAKKLHRMLKTVVKKYGVQSLVIETDCPDIVPMPLQSLGKINEPANVKVVFDTLVQILEMPADKLADELWQNSNAAFQTNFDVPMR